MTSNPKRPWFRFHLSTAIVLTIAASIAVFVNVELMLHPLFEHHPAPSHKEFSRRVEILHWAIHIAVPICSAIGLIFVAWLSERLYDWWTKTDWGW